MFSFAELSSAFARHFESVDFPSEPATLYEPNRYFLQMGGKRVRPVLCLMGNELFDEIHPGSWDLASAIELFHNFTLIHDDIMDNAPLRRGMETIPKKYGNNTAILSGDVMLIHAYHLLNKLDKELIHQVQYLFNSTAREVCEGQQYDMDFEKREAVSLDEYLRMIELKTSVLIAASLKLGSIMGGAGQRNQNLIYEFGRKLGLAFQVQDDYLDAFGDPAKFGKQVGGDILANKKTFLLIHALETANPTQKASLLKWLSGTEPGKVEAVLGLFRDCGVDEWALALKNRYLDEALKHLDDIAVTSERKKPLREMALFIVRRES